jgi:hypothetical protein
MAGGGDYDTKARPMTRRGFLLRLGAGSMLALWWVAGCTRRGLGRDEILERARALDPDLDCSRAPGLWPAEAATRTDNEYRDRSERELEYCFNCSNFVPAPEPAICGSCRTVKGPINPGGWCESWTEKT